MEIIITEQQYKKLITENVEGIEDFMDDLSLHYRQLKPEHLQKIRTDIESSGCEKMEWGAFTKEFVNSGGLSLPHGIILNNRILNYYPLHYTILTIFHEIAHQHQFKKYGLNIEYRLYEDDIDIDEAIASLKQIETTADQFGLRKCREYMKLGIINKVPTVGGYDEITTEGFTKYINMYKDKIKADGAKTPEEIGTLMYNWIKLI